MDKSTAKGIENDVSKLQAEVVELRKRIAGTWGLTADLKVSTWDWNQNGFENETDSSLSWSDSSPDRTLSIQPTGDDFRYWVGGQRYISTGDTVQITDVEGIHAIYYDGATLTSLAGPTSAQVDAVIRTKAIVSFVYWDTSASTAIYVGEERHGKGMSPSTHSYLHFTEGLRYIDGLGLNTIDADQSGSLNSHAQFGVDSGEVTDEDLFQAIAALTSTEGLPIYYMLGAAADWQKYTNSGFSVRTYDGTGSTRLAWNEYTGGAWQLTEVSNTDFVLCHVFATTEKDNPMIVVMGQGDYATKTQAQAGALTEIYALVLNDILLPEIKPVATVIFQTRDTYSNDVQARIVSTDDGDDYVDWRSETISRVSLSTTDHAALTNVTSDQHHAQAHDFTGADHTASGLTAGYVVRATGATTFAWAELQHSDIGNVTSDQHHAQAHDFTGADHTASGLTTGHVVRATGATTFEWAQLQHGDIGDVTADQHHAGFIGLDSDSGSATPDGSDAITVSGGSGVSTTGAASEISVSVNLVDAWSGLEFSSTELQVDLDAVFDWESLHTFKAGVDIDGTLEFQGPESITTTSGNLTLAPDGDIILDPNGNDVLPGTAYAVNVGALSNKYLTIHAAELWVETLVAQDTIATIGGRILIGPTTSLIVDCDVAETSIDVKHNQMTSGDRVVMEANGKLEWMAITSSPSVISGGYRYSVTRDLDGSGENFWFSGDAVFNTGTTDDGFIDLYSVAGVTPGSTAGPTIVGNVRNSSTYNDYTEVWAIGNLDGLYGYGVTTYGVGLGKYGTSHLTIDPTNGIKFYSGATVTGEWQPGGDFLLGEVATDKSNLFWDQSAGRLNFRGGTDGTEVQAYVDTDGAIYAGGGNVILDSDGISVPSGWLTGGANAYRITNSGNDTGVLYGTHTGSAHSITLLVPSVTSQPSDLLLLAETPAGYVADITISAVEDVSGTQQESTLSVTASGTDRVAVYDGDYFQINGNLRVQDVVASNDLDTYIDLHGTADQMAFYAGGIEIARFVEGADDYVNFFPAGGSRRVGINVSGNPISEIHAADDNSPAILTLERVDTSVDSSGIPIGVVDFRGGESTPASVGRIITWSDQAWTATASGTYMSLYTTPNNTIVATEKLRLTNNGNLGFNTTSQFGSGVGVIGIANAATNPSANPTGGGVMYSDAGAGKWRGSGGTTTTFGPAEPHCPHCKSDFVLEWESDRYGHLIVCMMCASEQMTSGVVKREVIPC